MTIEEHIEGLRLSLVQQSWSCNTPIGMANKKHDEELLELLEELIVLRKAYVLACSELEKHARHPNCELEPISNRGEEAIQEYFIDKAREELKNDY